MGKGNSGWVSFKYERLPNFCYQCGLLTHGDKDCLETTKRPNGENAAHAQYGLWLRAEPKRTQRKNWVTVEGRRNPFQCPPPTDKNNQGTPKVGTPMRKFSGPEVSDMETEKNPKTDLFDPKITPTNDQSFVEKLREIDRALNFC